MSTTVSVDGEDFEVPADGERDWANQITGLLVALANVSGGGIPALTLGAAGGTPNAYGASYDSGTGTLTLRPASATQPGIVSTGTQSFAGNKTFTGNVVAANISGTNSGNVTLGVPSGGLALAGQVLTQAAATVSAAGSMSAFHKENLDSLAFVSLTGGGVTADITAAISEAQSLGLKRVHIGDGTWTVNCGGLSDSSAMISVPDGFQITGNGPGRSIIYATNTTTGAGDNGVDIFRTPNSTSKQLFDGLHFRGTNGTDAASFAYAFNNQNGCITTGYTGISDVTVRNCYFEQLWGFSVHSTNDADQRVMVLDCKFINCANGVNVNASHSMVRGCSFKNSEGTESSGEYNVVMGNTFEDALGVGITIGGNQSVGQEFPGCVVVGNSIQGSTGAGITITDGMTGSVVANNHVRNCDLGGLILHGGVNPIRNCCIVNNVFDSNCKDPGANLVGIDVRDGDGGHLIFGNVSIDSAISGFAQAYGISLTVPDCVVFGNLFNGTTIDAQFSTGALRTREAGNVFVNNTHQWLNTATRASDAHTTKSSTDVVFRTRVYNLSSLEDRAYWSIDASGKQRWGDNLNTLVSEGVNLYRNATGVLKTDASFVAVGTVTGSNLSGTNTGDVTLAAIGASPNANAASLSGQVFNLQPASSSFGGVVTTGTQTFAGLKRIEASASGDHVFKVQNTHASGFSTSAFYDEGGTVRTIVGYDNLNDNSYLQAAGSIPLIFVTGSTARISVQSNGNVLVGSTTDASTGKLQVTGNGAFTGTLAVGGDLSCSSTSFYAITAGGGYLAKLGYGYAVWKDATPTTAIYLGMHRPGDAVVGDDMVFSTYTASTWTERARLTNAGVFQIGGVTALSQTNTVTGITNKTFTAATTVGLLATQTTTAAPITVRNTNASGFSTVSFQDDGSVFRTAVGYDNVNDISYIQAAGALHFVTNGNNRGNIDTSGVLTWTGNITMNAGVQVLDQTNTVSSITNKTFSGLTHSGTMALGTSTVSGTPNFSGAATLGGVAFLSQTNTVTGITNKTFTSLTHSGTMALGTTTISGTPNFSGAATMNSVDLLSQTNTVSGITNKTFTSPTLNTPAINNAAMSGTWTGGATLPALTLSGVQTYQAINLDKTTSTITAFAGGGSASATILTSTLNFVTTCATAGDSVRLPSPGTGMSIVVHNLGAAACNVYPGSGVEMDALGTNVPYSLAPGTARVFDARTSNWYWSRP